jgi:hypothetical protein
MGLTAKQQAFVDEYVRCWNASEAARRAGYSPRTAYSIGQRLLKHVEAQAAIGARVDEMAMGADEALTRLAEQARADYVEYILADGSVDLARMKRDGMMHLVKGIKPTRHGLMVEFVDAQAALFKIAAVHGLPRERVEVEVTDVGEQLTGRIDRLAARVRERIGAGGDRADDGGA